MKSQILVKLKKYALVALAGLFLVIVITFWFRHYFVFGEGVKAGNLNFIVKKGFVFKTYEGRLIQEGLKTKVAGAVQNNEFDFSVTNDSIAEILERCGGKQVELRYKEYLHPVMWRGMSNYVVYEVLSVDGK
jgi:hypothetical protein